MDNLNDKINDLDLQVAVIMRIIWIILMIN